MNAVVGVRPWTNAVMSILKYEAPFIQKLYNLEQ